NGSKIVFTLRSGVTFPDGSPFTADDVVATFQKLLDPALHSPVADTFKTAKGTVAVSAQGKLTVAAEFPAPVAQIERLFDSVAIISAKATARPSPGLGPFLLAERKPGVSMILKRNPAYWKKPLPVADSIRIDIEQNRDLELVRFQRGEI